MQKGDLIICNDVIGFVVEVKDLTFIVNTSTGLKELSLMATPVIMATAQEIAQTYSNQLAKVVCTN